jgi:alpha-glucosidase
MFEFDKPEYSAVEEQFLVGGDLLITPVLKKGETKVKGHFPEAGGEWRDWYTDKVGLTPNIQELY